MSTPEQRRNRDAMVLAVLRHLRGSGFEMTSEVIHSEMAQYGYTLGSVRASLTRLARSGAISRSVHKDGVRGWRAAL